MNENEGRNKKGSIEDNINKIDGDYIKKHQCNDMGNRIRKWFKSIENDYDKGVYLLLMEQFRYYSRENIIEALRKVHKEVTDFDKNIDYTIFFPMFSYNGNTNHSFEIQNMYRDANKLSKYCFPTNINLAIEKLPMNDISNIIFIDDMIGTGETIKKSIREIHKKYKSLFNKNIYILVLEVPENIMNIEEDINEELDINIKIIYLNKHKKAFDSGYIFDEKNKVRAKEVIKKYDTQLTKNANDILGYGNSEFLLGFYYDTPNNTIISLWKQNEDLSWNPPFYRSTKISHRPKWLKSSKQYGGARQLKYEKEQRKNMNYRKRLKENNKK